MLPWALTIFLSAFLLFQVQPLMAKILLPWFGGSAGVWTTCLLFFQVLLLLGYLYAHGSIRYLPPRAQGMLHLSLLGLSLLSLPILPKEGWKPTGTEDPAFKIALLLLATVGLPYFLLSTTGPLLQAWYAARTVQTSGGTEGEGTPPAFPYRLYALSNAGSMLALVSYPFLVEPFLTTKQQSNLWSVGYLFFVLFCGGLALRFRFRSKAATEPQPEASAEVGMGKPSVGQSLTWLAYAACSCTMLLAVSTHLSHNVASIPFLWILPLSLYLLSFILCFGNGEWRWTRMFLLLPPAAVGVMALLLSDAYTNEAPRNIILPFSAAFFVVCIVCHGEIARMKPAPHHLTAFYLMISLGGAIGGAFVAVIAPMLFTDYYELPLGIAAFTLLAFFTLYRHSRMPWWKPSELAKGVAVLLLLGYLFTASRDATGGYHWSDRNFYGVMRVKDETETDGTPVRKFYSGSILHCKQYLSEERHMEPLSSYTLNTGIGRTFRRMEGKGPIHVGVIGLGAGALATYGKAGDTFRFYEIDPLAIHMARKEFTFLRDSRAKIEVVAGDARLSLERERDQAFDLLVMDAFFSDAIPVHLLTREAFGVYLRHLKPDGILALNISNRYLDLRPVIERAAHESGKEVRLVEEDGPSWALMAEDPAFFHHPLLRSVAEGLGERPDFRIWTDGYSNLYRIVK